ncbi:MAG: hypothetical protein A2Z42_03165 [Candidatus Woykebacteria bacterium RBG_19FT_COMBO_43_10]|uniref:PsbP C-terminal domain-containing protein n=1 Tax=Candidatus Woykebacteria bacterium RBG_19FT_COMBO_43_10 TaxID=1802598 RepID=A0A1G1WKQ3_9BACT|nr:MAG: hypothetical protein A2Z42_03165 [Candidatus Woykebacteria bacterium RBG_19FT_COMBO_43_10]
MPDVSTESQITPSQRAINWKTILIIVVIGTVLIGLGVLIYLVLQPREEATAPSAKIPTSSAKKDELLDWKVYSSKTLGVSVKYPNNWDEPTEIETTVIFDGNDPVLGLVNVELDKESADESFYIELSKMEVNKPESIIDPSSVIITRLSDIIVDGYDGLVMTKTKKSKNELIYNLFIKKSDDYYRLIVFGKETKQTETKKLFDNIVSTFKFLD